MGCSQAGCQYKAGTSQSAKVVAVRPKRLASRVNLVLPEHWKSNLKDVPFRICVDCDKEQSDEMVNVQHLLDKTLSQESGTRLKIERMVRVEHVDALRAQH